MFRKITLDYKENLFPELQKTTDFEDVIKGRTGTVLVDVQNNLIPLVRTTTVYTTPPQKFKQVHYDIIDKIKQKTDLNNINFNNALIEIYDNQYCKMGFHSDQALDLQDDSYIAIYSCYENPETLTTQKCRKLIVQNKTTKELSEIVMDHNSVILFHTSTNQQYLHKIVLENNHTKNRWLGITFRLSKTFVQHKDNIPHLHPSNKILTLANEEEQKTFYKLRSEENKSTNFQYPEITFTISPSERMTLITYESSHFIR